MNRTVLRFTLLAAVSLVGNALASQAPVAPPTAPQGDGWQLLSSSSSVTSGAQVQTSASPMPAAPRVLDASTSPAAVASAPVSTLRTVTTTAVATVDVTATAVTPTTAPAKTWSVNTSDTNFRQLLDHWTQQEGWKLVWSYGQDVPIVGDDTFTSDFKSAARRALRSTELTDTPIKPCFYSNDTMRVVSFTTQCDPTRTAAAQ
ncbi:Toxin co-regulated pilus biosynthesis protein Q C-terminal domain-containing protein (plasmid) [Pararobbsia alpina]|uniref:toxin co-regulated pilus biosynthesis Q family protein n=1 Tax=Pararobbsia alpina TaxID=621374 RepID=UPI0039A661D8